MQIQVSNKFQVMARLQKDRLQGKRSRDFSRLDPRVSLVSLCANHLTVVWVA